MSAHYVVEGSMEPDGDDWISPRCNCGQRFGMFPTAEDAADALMEHAYDKGHASALKDVVAMSPARAANSQEQPS